MEEDFRIKIAFGGSKDGGDIELFGNATFDGEYHEVLKEVAQRYILFCLLLASVESTRDMDTALAVDKSMYSQEDFEQVIKDLDWWVNQIAGKSPKIWEDT